jgi:lambda family phage portal protein
LLNLAGKITAFREWADPTWAARRLEASRRAEREQRAHEVQLRLIERHFDGADVSDRNRADAWLGSRLSADSFLDADLETLRDHADELYRSFPLITGAIEHRTDNVIGSGLRPKAAIRETAGITADRAEALNKQINELWAQWEPHAGRGGRQTFGEVLRLAHKTWKRQGDSLVIKSVTPHKSRPIPLQLNVIDPWRLSTPPRHVASENIRLGVERDGEGSVVGYHVQNAHPYESVDPSDKWTRYDAEDVCHLYEELWPDQTRGLPWCFSVLNACRDLKDFTEAVVIAAQISACQTYIVSTDNAETLARMSRDSNGQQRMAPGQIPYTDLDTKITAFNPSQPQTTYPMFCDTKNGEIAAGLHYPKAWLTRDRSQATFSAGKLEEIEGGVPLRADFQVVKSQLISSVWTDFVRLAVLSGKVDITADEFNENEWVFTRYSCVPAGRPWIDPNKEVKASVEAIQNNLTTLETELARQGKDIDDVIPQRSIENAKQKAADVIPPVPKGSVEAPDEMDGDPKTKPLGAAE